MVLAIEQWHIKIGVYCGIYFNSTSALVSLQPIYLCVVPLLSFNMPKANKSPAVPAEVKKPRKRTTSKKAKGPSTSLDSLIKINAAGKTQHLKAARTREAYKGYLRRAKEFLATLVETECNAETEGNSEPIGELSGEGEQDEVDKTEEMMRDPEFARALDGAPSKYTPQVIALFLAYHCFDVGDGKSTADGIHAAFVYEYDHM